MQISNKLAVAWIGVAMFLQLACGGARHETTEVYVLVTTNTKIPYWQEAVEGLRAAARDLGVKAEMVGPDTYDPKAEKQQLAEVVQRKITPAGILVSAADPELMKDAIDQAVGAGIPVVTIDSDSPKSKRLTFIGTNNYVAGQMSGDLLAKELNGKGNVVLYTIQGQGNLEERLEGWKRATSRSPGIKVAQIVNMAGDPTKAFDGTQGLIEKGKTPPDAFVCLEALSCSEVANVLDRANMRDKLIIAMDTQEGTMTWLGKGMIRATIAQKPYTMAYFGTRVLDDFHHAKPSEDPGNQGKHAVEPVFIDTGATLVDKSNMASFMPAPATK